MSNPFFNETVAGAYLDSYFNKEEAAKQAIQPQIPEIDEKLAEKLTADAESQKITKREPFQNLLCQAAQLSRKYRRSDLLTVLMESDSDPSSKW